MILFLESVRQCGKLVSQYMVFPGGLWDDYVQILAGTMYLCCICVLGTLGEEMYDSVKSKYTEYMYAYEWNVIRKCYDAIYPVPC